MGGPSGYARKRLVTSLHLKKQGEYSRRGRRCQGTNHMGHIDKDTLRPLVLAVSNKFNVSICF